MYKMKIALLEAELAAEGDVENQTNLQNTSTMQNPFKMPTAKMPASTRANRIAILTSQVQSNNALMLTLLKNSSHSIAPISQGNAVTYPSSASFAGRPK